jgi:hypothetical protein
MKRLLVLLAIATALAAPAFSFDPSRHNGNRIAVLQAPIYNGGEYENRIATSVRRQLVRELRDRGYDAVDSRVSYEELQRSGRTSADLYVELAPADMYAHPTGGVTVRTRSVAVDVAVVVSRVAAELRLYDGRTLDLIEKKHLRRENVTVVPTDIGVGTYRMAVWFVLPFVEYVRYRSAISAVVRDAASVIISGR